MKISYPMLGIQVRTVETLTGTDFSKPNFRRPDVLGKLTGRCSFSHGECWEVRDAQTYRLAWYNPNELTFLDPHDMWPARGQILDIDE